MDSTTLLRTILHVRHAFRHAELGNEETDDPITPSMLVQARLLQDEFLRLNGRDLTIADPLNKLWHTRNPVPLHTDSPRTRRPWEFLECVKDARSAGKGRATTETAEAFVRRFVWEHFFQF